MDKQGVRYLNFPDYNYQWQEKLLARGVPVERVTCGGKWMSGCTRMKGHTGRHSMGGGARVWDVWS